MEADVITYNATISACEKGQQWITAVSLLQEMQQWHMEPDVITYNATISACEKGQQWITAVSLLLEMRQWHMEPNVFTYVVLCNSRLHYEQSHIVRP